MLAGFASTIAHAAEVAYDESADATASLESALASASVAKVPVLAIFGANWCEDCRALDGALKSPEYAARLGREFRIVKVDVGNFDKNLLLTLAYGNPTAGGIPAAVVLSPDNRVLYTTRAGELAGARRIGAGGIYEFFKRVSTSDRP